MDVSQQLNQLEASSDWHGLAALLEKAIADEQDPNVLASYHLKLGRVRPRQEPQSQGADENEQNRRSKQRAPCRVALNPASGSQTGAGSTGGDRA